MVTKHRFAVGDLVRNMQGMEEGRILKVVKLLDPVDDWGLQCLCVDIIDRTEVRFVREHYAIPVRRTPRIALACWLAGIANRLVEGDRQ